MEDIMGTSIRTRDGSVSVAALMQSQDDVAGKKVPATLGEVVAWGRKNGVTSLGRDGVRKVNARRRLLDLPPFVVVSVTAAPPVTCSSGQHAAPEVDGPALPAGTSLLVASEQELHDLITQHTGTRTGLVTPEIAGWLLDLNKGNRPMNSSAVRRFCDILEQGRWRNTGEPVIVSREAILNDGQHRLSAIYESEVAAEMDVRFGVPRDVFYVTGTGTRRTAANVVAIAGHANATKQAGMARLLHYHDLGQMALHAQKTDNDTVLEVIGRNPLIGEVAAMTSRFTFKPARTCAFGFALVLAARVAPMDRVATFANSVATGLAASEGDAAHRLHVRLMAREQRTDQLDVAVLTVRAWNAWIEGREVERLSVRDTDRTSAGFPKMVRPEDIGGAAQP
jgi:hypothetical protein